MELTVQDALLKGIEAHKEGKLQDAERFYRAILQADPKHPDANHNLGVLAVGVGKAQESLPFFKKALEADPSQPQFWVSCINAFLQVGQGQEAAALLAKGKEVGLPNDVFVKLEARVNEGGPVSASVTADSNHTRNIENLFQQGLKDYQAGKWQEAKAAYQKILSLDPSHFDALHLLGVIESQTQNHLRAIELINQAIQINPNVAAAYSNLGNVFQELKQYDQALASYDKAISLKPDYAQAWSNRGVTLQELQRYEQALASFDEAIRTKPEIVEAWYNRGLALQGLHWYDQALASFDKAIRLKSDYVQAWSNRGVTLQELQRYDQALASFDEAIRLKPDFADALSNRGIALKELKQYEQALASFDEAIRLKPDFAKAWYNRGNTLQAIGRSSLAEASYREAIRLDPEHLEARSNFLFSSNYSELLSPVDALNEAKRFGSKVSKRIQSKFTSWDVAARAQKLRIGFVSGDLGNHPVGYFIEGLLERLDKSQFDLFACPTTSRNDDLTGRIKPFFREWIPIYGMSDRAAATLIHQKGIHILIDLSGHSAHNRLAVFAYKPAPVQVSWLGYFASTGVPEIDYFLGDPIMSPESEQHHFTETLWSLPKTWLCLKPPIELVSISDLPALTSGFVTFGCFGNFSKMNDEVILVWSKILKTISQTKLYLKSNQYADPEVIKIVHEKFAAHGILGERLICEGPSPRTAYFEAYNGVDIVLDTFPYPGGTTSVDAHWMGVPVLTLKGDRFLSHLGESIATTAGQKDWIAEDHDDYVNKAVQFATDLGYLANLRSTLRDRVLMSPLFDTPQFAKDFGEALWGMWNQYSQEIRSNHDLSISKSRATASNRLKGIKNLFQQGLKDYQAGKWQEAKAAYQKILSLDPSHFDALHLLGVIESQTQNHLRAIELINQAIQINPNVAVAYSNLGNVFQELKQYDQALASFDKAIRLKPDYADAWYNRGNTLQELKQYEQALVSYDKAIGFRPDYVQAWYNRGNTLQELKQYEQAVASYDKAIGFRPDYVQAWSNRGVTLQELQRYEQALASFDEAIRLKPDFSNAWCNRGNALQELQRYEQALASFDEAIRLKPDFIEPRYNRGNTLKELRQYDKALASFDEAIRLKPDFVDAWCNRGNTLQAIGRSSLAEASYREAIRLDPEHLEARSNLLFSSNYSELLSPIDALNEAKRFGLKVSEKAKPRFTTWKISTSFEKLRVGFVSGDLNNHSVGYFIEGLFERLDKSQFDLFACPTTSRNDDLTGRIKPFFKEWIPIYGMSDQAAATLIHQKGIHILIDLSGHSAHNRLAVFAYKPAPVQVSWLGLPMTTGVSEIDYVLGDPYALPQEFENQFTETIWRLPKTYLCLTAPTEPHRVGPLPAARNQCITFGSFNNLSKMNDKVVEVWSNILNRLPNARLLLKTKQLSDANECSRTRIRFQHHGVTLDRLILKDYLGTRDEHLSAYNEIDIALDTFLYPGVTTSAEAMWMGVPVLSLKGNDFLSCTAKSIAQNTGLNDWVAEDHDDYVNKAVQFATDLGYLANLRNTLRDRVLMSPLFDTPQFAKDFGEALWGMWNQYSQVRARLINE